MQNIILHFDKLSAAAPAKTAMNLFKSNKADTTMLESKVKTLQEEASTTENMIESK
jgi:hypothetical protein